MIINKKSAFRHDLLLTAGFNLLLTIAAVLFLTVSCGQQQSKTQNKATMPIDIHSIAKMLAEQVPEINEKYDITYSSDNNSEKEIDLKHYLYRYTNNDSEYDRRKLQMFWYELPTADKDLVFVSYVDGSVYGFHPWLKCFTFDPKTSALKETETPFVIPSPREFDKEEFDDTNEYWRSEFNILNDGSIVISASLSMNATCLMLVNWNKNDGFKLYKRGINISYGTPIEDDSNAELFVRNFIRPNFQRINAIEKWKWIDKKTIRDRSLEGANIEYFYSNDGLEKIVVSCSNENSNTTYEYYFLNHYLSFVFSTKKENSGQVKERRWYIKEGFCFRGIGDNGKLLSLDDENVQSDLINETEQIFELIIKN
ncbi:MAG: hypothetical protein FWH18_01435 [Marinilabiliaceae bacterium]|nr:hypothetical protein [Marinilabiliaceae bacterium]